MKLPLKKMIKVIVQAWPHVKGIYLFGSAAKKETSPASDVDLAVLSRTPLPESQRFDLAQEAAAVAGRDVDLVDLYRAPTVLQFQIVSQGERIHSGDAAACERFEDFVYKSYAFFNEERRGLLEDIQQRGTIF